MKFRCLIDVAFLSPMPSSLFPKVIDMSEDHADWRPSNIHDPQIMFLSPRVKIVNPLLISRDAYSFNKYLLTTMCKVPF